MLNNVSFVNRLTAEADPSDDPIGIGSPSFLFAIRPKHNQPPASIVASGLRINAAEDK